MVLKGSVSMGLREKNVLMLLHERTEKFSDKVALGMKTKYGWKEFTYSGIGLLSRKIAHYLIKATDLQLSQNQNLNMELAYLHQLFPE